MELAALNGIEVNVGDIENAYVTAQVTEKIWTKLGEEFGADAGKKAIIVRALYGLKSSGTAFLNHLSGCMRHIGYTSCLADPDLWMNLMTKVTGDRYYSYILNYVDEILVISEEDRPILARLRKHFKLKAGSVVPPANYLGTKLRLTRLPNGVVEWVTSPSHYVQEAKNCCKKHVVKTFKGKYIWFGKAPHKFVMNYDACTDVSTVCTANEASYFQLLIGIMRWMLEF